MAACERRYREKTYNIDLYRHRESVLWQPAWKYETHLVNLAAIWWCRIGPGREIGRVLPPRLVQRGALNEVSSEEAHTMRGEHVRSRYHEERCYNERQEAITEERHEFLGVPEVLVIPYIPRRRCPSSTVPVVAI